MTTANEIGITSFSPKLATEDVPLTFNFKRLALAPTAPAWTITHVDGPADPTPTAMQKGTPVVDGSRVTLWHQGGVPGATYLVQCQVDDGASRWIGQGLLRVR